VNDYLLQIKGLKTYFYTGLGIAKAVDDLTLSVEKGHILGIVGESGCGKSVTALSIMRLVKSPPGRIEAGEIRFNGTSLLDLSPADMRKIRGNRISMIFQEPMTSLNPVQKVGDQISECFKLHTDLSKKDIRTRSVEMLKTVGIPAPAKRAREYPHQMSGGMRQRIMIAMALACSPELMIADEPTTALDVTIQAQILNIMLTLKADTGTSMILITHDLGVIAETAESVAVMYAGKLMEFTSVVELFNNPLHPYTVGLLKSIPRPDVAKKKGTALDTIRGVVPKLTALPEGCRFSDRCGRADNRCFHEAPPLTEAAPGHRCRCWLHAD